MAGLLERFHYGSKASRFLTLLLQSAALVAGWALWAPAGLEEFSPALIYVVAAWIVAGGITLGAYLAFSLAPFPELLAEASLASANAMWLVPGTLLLAARWPVAVTAGLVVVINSMRLLALSRAPRGKAIVRKRRAPGETGPRLFRYQPAQPVYFSRETLPPVLGALVLYAGVYALAGQYPLLAAVSFATATAIWVGMSVARGALEARVAASVLYPVAGVLLTLLWTVTLTSALLHIEIVLESPAPIQPVIGIGEAPETPGMTTRVLQRLAHVPPAPAAPSKVEAQAPKTIVTRMVDPSPAIGAKDQNGVPGVVLRPRPKHSQKPPLVVPGARLHLSPGQPLMIPFTGEYQLFRTSSGSLPPDSIAETGSPLESIYGTTNGGPMETVAVQTFDPPIDLTHCGRVLVSLTSAETMPLLASMQLVSERSVEDGGTELMGTKGPREEMLVFQVPSTTKRLLVNAIRISFQRPAFNRNKNVRVAVERFTLSPRER